MQRTRIRTEDFLANLPLFTNLNRASLTRIAAGTSEINAPRGTIVFRRGDLCTGFHVAIFGYIKLAVHASDGNEKVMDLVGPGQSFGDAAAFLGHPHMTSAETLADSKVLHVDKDTVLAEVAREPRFAGSLIANLSDRLQRLMGTLEGHMLRTGTQRVIGYLLSELPAAAGHAAALIALPAKKGIIASWLNLTQEHFSRILHELASAGLIEVRGREISIVDVERLRAHQDGAFNAIPAPHWYAAARLQPRSAA